MTTSNFPNQGTVYLEGNPVKQVSLLTGSATPQNSPKVINGESREQIILCDPLTGLPYDLIALIAAAGGLGAPTNWQTITPVGPDTTPIPINWLSGPNVTLNPPIDSTQVLSVPTNMPDGQSMEIDLVGGGASVAWQTYSAASPTVPGYAFLSAAPSAPSAGSIQRTFVKRNGFKYYVTIGDVRTQA